MRVHLIPQLSLSLGAIGFHLKLKFENGLSEREENSYFPPRLSVRRRRTKLRLVFQDELTHFANGYFLSVRYTVIFFAQIVPRMQVEFHVIIIIKWVFVTCQSQIKFFEPEAAVVYHENDGKLSRGPVWLGNVYHLASSNKPTTNKYKATEFRPIAPVSSSTMYCMWPIWLWW